MVPACLDYILWFKAGDIHLAVQAHGEVLLMAYDAHRGPGWQRLTVRQFHGESGAAAEGDWEIHHHAATVAGHGAVVERVHLGGERQRFGVEADGVVLIGPQPRQQRVAVLVGDRHWLVVVIHGDAGNPWHLHQAE